MVNIRRDGFQFVLDVAGDVVCDIRGVDVDVYVVVTETGECGGVLSKSDPERDGSVGRKVRRTQPVCMDPRSYQFFGTRCR